MLRREELEWGGRVTGPELLAAWSSEFLALSLFLLPSPPPPQGIPLSTDRKQPLVIKWKTLGTISLLVSIAREMGREDIAFP